MGDLEHLEAERNNLDILKDKLNAAQQEYDDLLVRETGKEESYRWFDLKDREYSECRVRLCEKIHALERASSQSITSVSTSSKSSSFKKSSKKSSASSVLLARANSVTKTAKLEVEMIFSKKRTSLNACNWKRKSKSLRQKKGPGVMYWTKASQRQTQWIR